TPRPTGSRSVAASAAATPAKAPEKKQSSENQSSPSPSSSARRAARTIPSGGIWLPRTTPTGGRSGTGFPQLVGRGKDGLNDLLVARAAAEIAGQCEAYLVLGGLAPLGQQRRGRHQHARRTEPALDPAGLDERALEGMRLPVAGQALHRGHLAAVRLESEKRAGVQRPAVEQDHAGSALRVVAALLRARQPDFATQHGEERASARDSERVADAVHGQRQGIRQARARSSARSRARRTTRGICARRYRSDARTSEIGAAASAASAAASPNAAGVEPRSASSAAATRMHVGATAVSATRASSIRPSSSSAS